MWLKPVLLAAARFHPPTHHRSYASRDVRDSHGRAELDSSSLCFSGRKLGGGHRRRLATCVRAAELTSRKSEACFISWGGSGQWHPPSAGVTRCGTGSRVLVLGNSLFWPLSLAWLASTGRLPSEKKRRTGPPVSPSRAPASKAWLDRDRWTGSD